MELGERRDVLALDAEAMRPWWTLRQTWMFAGAVALLLVAVGFLGMRLIESDGQIERLRAELRDVYTEAESLRTQAVQAQQRVTALEAKVRQLSADREAQLKKLKAPAEANAPLRRPELSPRPSAKRPVAPAPR